MYRSFFWLICLIPLFFGCGVSNEADLSTDTGSAVFGVEWQGAPTLAPQAHVEKSSVVFRAAAIDCTASGVSTVQVIVYDSSNNSIASGGPWNCSDHSGTINSIPAGSNIKFVVTGKDSSGNVLYQGEKTGVTITAGQTTNLGAITASAVGIVYNAHTISDGGSNGGTGNNDGIINKGETISMYVTLKNTGSSDANGVMAALSTTDSYVSVISSYDTGSFGTISGNNGTSSNSGSWRYEFTILNTAPSGHVVTFNLAITDDYGNSWSTSFTVTIAQISATIVYDAHTISDGGSNGGTGNNDGIINKGETISMYVTLKNTGSSDANGVMAALSTTDSYVSVISSYDTGSFGTISGNNGTSSNSGSWRYEFTVLNTAPSGHVVTFNLAITDDYGNSWSSSFTVTIY